MKRKISFLFKTVLFIGILSVFVLKANKILIPKYISDGGDITSTYSGFYEMEENSIDVIFLGSSRAASAFSPQELYEQYKIRSYNLGGTEQNILVSYYWLLEALRFQKPKVVVLETTMLFSWKEDQILNTPIESTRKALENMKWSRVKCKAIRDVCRFDESQTWESYYFSNMLYHQRWEELTRVDFEKIISGERGLKGQIIFANGYIDWDEERFEAETSDNQEDMQDVMREYLNRIVELCQAQGIKLILVSTPSAYGSVEKYNTMVEYAEKNKLYYVDYNEMEKNKSIQYNYEVDNAEYSHVGINGTLKIAEDIGKILIDQFKVEGIEDKQWKISKEYYYQTIKGYRLREICDVEKYIKQLDDSNYMVFMVSQNISAYKDLSEAFANIIKKLEVKDNWGEKNSGDRYCAVISNGDVIEENSYAMVKIVGNIEESGIYYVLLSDGDKNSIMINGTEYMKENNGLKIVVFDLVRRIVVDNINLSYKNGIYSIER